MASPPRVLSIAGTDPLGGAGVIADCLTLAECGVVPLAAATAIVDQDSTGVRGFGLVAEPWFSASVRAALADGRPQVVKVGMLGSADHARAVGDLMLAVAVDNPAGVRWLVFDPVLSSQAGVPMAAPALAQAAVELAARLSGRMGVLLTPNVAELASLVDGPAATEVRSLCEQARALAANTGASVLAKGGHLGEAGWDVIVIGTDLEVLAPEPWPTPAPDVHGTGCRLSSLIAARLAHGDDVSTAVRWARRDLIRAVTEQTARVGAGRLQFVPSTLRR